MSPTVAGLNRSQLRAAVRRLRSRLARAKHKRGNASPSELARALAARLARQSANVARTTRFTRYTG